MVVEISNTFSVYGKNHLPGFNSFYRFRCWGSEFRAFSGGLRSRYAINNNTPPALPTFPLHEPQPILTPLLFPKPTTKNRR